MKSKKRHSNESGAELGNERSNKRQGGRTLDDDYESWNDWDADELNDIARQFNVDD